MDLFAGEDTYKTFEEVLRIAQERNVDLILLGGDLFHDSKPTQQCIHRCISLIRKYCMGDRWEVKCRSNDLLISHNFLNVQMRLWIYSLCYGASVIWIVVRFQYQEASMWNTHNSLEGFCDTCFPWNASRYVERLPKSLSWQLKVLVIFLVWSCFPCEYRSI